MSGTRHSRTTGCQFFLKRSRPLWGPCRKLKEGQRVVGVPWPSAEGEGTWQQYVAAPLENLVSDMLCLGKMRTSTKASISKQSSNTSETE